MERTPECSAGWHGLTVEAVGSDVRFGATLQSAALAPSSSYGVEAYLAGDGSAKGSRPKRTRDPPLADSQLEVRRRELNAGYATEQWLMEYRQRIVALGAMVG